MTEEKRHPRGWTLQQLIEWSKGTVNPLTEDSSTEDIVAARNKAIGEMLQKGIREKKEAMLRVKERVKMHYEMGTAMKAICASYNVRSREVEKWAKREHWNRPADEVPDLDEDGKGSPLLADSEFAIVTRADEEKLPTHVRQMREQNRLMNLRGKQWEKVPYAMWPEALRMRLAGQVRRAIERMENMDEDELMGDLKSLKTLSEVLEKVAPIPEEATKGKTLLHLSIFNGEEGLPLKAAKPALPVQEAEVIPERDPML